MFKIILKFIGINIILFIIFSTLGFGYVYLNVLYVQNQDVPVAGYTLPQPILFKSQQNSERLPYGLGVPTIPN